MQANATTVVQCVNNMDVGGAEQLALTLADHLRRRGFASLICCIEEPGMLAEAAKRRDIEVHALHLADAGKFASYRSFCKLLRARRPAVVHSHNLKPYHFGAWARLTGAAAGHVHTRHGAFLRDRSSASRYRLLNRWSDQIFAVSESVRVELTEVAGLSDDKIRVLPNGVDTELFCPSASKSALRCELGLSGDCLAVVVAARLSPEKDLTTLLRAFAIVTRSLANAELWIAGYGPELEKLRAFSRELGVDQKTRFLGPRSDVHRLLAAADVFALSSVAEGLPVSLLEAAACGLPLVATRVGDNERVINPPAGGRIVNPRAPEELATALLEILRDEPARERMGRAARQHVVERFGLEQMVSGYVRAYEAAVSSHT